MSSKRIRLAAPGLALAGVLLLGGCATTPPEEDPVTIRLNDLDRRLERLERVLSNQSLLELSRQIQALQADLRSLRGDLEEVQHQAGRLESQQRSQYGDLDKRLQALQANQLAQPAGEVAAALPVPGGSDRANYQAAIELLGNGRYDQAVTGLQQFLLAFPSSGLAGNAKYWLGEAHYMMGQYDQARAALERVGREHPGSPVAEDAAKKLEQMRAEGR